MDGDGPNKKKRNPSLGRRRGHGWSSLQKRDVKRKKQGGRETTEKRNAEKEATGAGFFFGNRCSSQGTGVVVAAS